MPRPQGLMCVRARAAPGAPRRIAWRVLRCWVPDRPRVRIARHGGTRWAHSGHRSRRPRRPKSRGFNGRNASRLIIEREMATVPRATPTVHAHDRTVAVRIDPHGRPHLRRWDGRHATSRRSQGHAAKRALSRDQTSRRARTNDLTALRDTS